MCLILGDRRQAVEPGILYCSYENENVEPKFFFAIIVLIKFFLFFFFNSDKVRVNSLIEQTSLFFFEQKLFEQNINLVRTKVIKFVRTKNLFELNLCFVRVQFLFEQK